MTFMIAYTRTPNAALCAQEAEISSIKVGNMMSVYAQDEMRSQSAQQIHKKYPDAGYYTENVRFYLKGEHEKNVSYRSRRSKDGYDIFRLPENICSRLHDPVLNVPAMFAFAENGQAIFTAHFADDKPSNSENGYHALHFNENGDVVKVAIVEAQDNLCTYDLSGEIPDRLSEIITTAAAIKAPHCKSVLKMLAGALEDEQIIKSLHDTYTRQYKEALVV